jgi:hypothetical protein
MGLNVLLKTSQTPDLSESTDIVFLSFLFVQSEDLPLGLRFYNLFSTLFFNHLLSVDSIHNLVISEVDHAVLIV